MKISTIMSSTVHNWIRYWAPQGEIVSVDHLGYFKPPEPSASWRDNEKCVTLTSLQDAHCLVLLGEPGSGKSYELNKAYELSRQLNEEACNGNVSLFFNLRAYNSRTDLQQSIFSSSQVIAWRDAVTNGQQPILTLFLDSLDEGLIEIRNLAFILEEELGLLPLSRLRFRISCRTAEWPIYLIHALERLWKKSSGFSVLEKDDRGQRRSNSFKFSNWRHYPDKTFA